MRPQKITIDTNKILAAVLKPGKVRERLFNTPTIIITPKHAWQEASKHIERLAARKGVEKDKLKEILEEIKREIIVELDPKQPYITTAKGIASRFDPDDWPFIALALQHNTPIWTNDSELIRDSLKTEKYKAIDTQALEMLLEGKPWNKIEKYLKEKYGERRKTQQA
ncbi:MAG: PIN domain-containing protein [Desulfurococcales archaeon]|nr:PIN domain-containing protein [Desulfurococcales archaeon]